MLPTRHNLAPFGRCAKSAAQRKLATLAFTDMNPRPLSTILSIPAMCLLSACAGVPVNDVRNSPIVHESVSNHPMNDVLSCLTATLDEFRGDGRMLSASYPQPPMVEISIGAIQMGSFRHHYLLMITGFDGGTKVLVRSSGTTYIPMSQSALIKKVTACT